MKRPRISIDSTKDVVLFRLHHDLSRGMKHDYSLGVFSNKIGLPQSILKMAVDRLQEEGFCSVTTITSIEEHPIYATEVEVETTVLGITENGIAHIENMSDDQYASIAQKANLDKLEMSNLFDDEVNEELYESSKFTINASDRVVTVDHNSREYTSAVDSVDNVISAVRGDNKFSIDDPDEKDKVLNELAAGRKILESAKISINKIKTVLLDTMTYLSKFGVAVAQIADSLDKLRRLFGL